MFTSSLVRVLRLGLLLAVASCILVACSSEDSTAPIATPAPSASDAWEREIDALAAMDGGAALLAGMEPLLREARESYLEGADKRGGALFVAVQKTTIEVVPPFPPPVTNMIINYKGIGTLLGPHQGQSPSSVDVTVMPWVQTGRATMVGMDGSELICDYIGTATPTSAEGDVAFEGSFTVIGGSGRFANATGDGNYQGTANQVAARGQIIWWGAVDMSHN